METPGSHEIVIKHPRRGWIVAGVIALTFLVGAMIGQIVGGGGFVRAAVQTDATPETLSESEREELNRLRTAVAQTPVCETVTPTAAAEPMSSPVAVEPLAVGTTVQIADDWEVTVKGITIPAASFRDTPTGRYLQVEVTIFKNSDSGGHFAWGDWILVDEQGREYEVHHGATIDASSTGYYRGIAPRTEETFLIVYDVANDAGSTFTYVYRPEPTIQYALTLQTFG